MTVYAIRRGQFLGLAPGTEGGFCVFRLAGRRIAAHGGSVRWFVRALQSQTSLLS